MSDQVTRVMLATRLDKGVQLNDTYEIDERIASGGMGEVYRGHNIQTGEPVAIKTILPEFADQESIFALFKKEATVLGRLHHDTIVHYYSFSRDPRLGRPYLAMEFVDGISLADRIQNAPLTPDEVRQLFANVADGLALAHGAGVIHRDLSPDNIILRGGNVARPKIIDFGIARSANTGEGTLIGGGFAGKYNFVSPEQLGIHNREVDARSDIYCLGLVIAAALRGKPIDMGGSHVDVIEKRSRLPDLSDIDASLRPLVEAMLQPNPNDRPPDAGAVAQWLRASAPAKEPAAAGVTPAWTGAPQTGGSSSVPSWTALPPRVVPLAAEPTQIIASTSQPFAAPQPPTPPPAGGSESPFGNASAYPSLGAYGTPPPGALAGDTATRKSGAGRYALLGVLALVLAGGAGAYMTGMIDLGQKTPAQPQADKPAEQPPPVATTEPAPTATGKTAASPEHEAIGEALEDFAKADQPAADAAAKPTGQPATQPAETASGTQPAAPAEQPADTTAPADTAAKPETVAVAEPTEQPPSSTASETASPPPAETAAQPSEPATQPATQPTAETKVAAAGLTKMMDVGVSWLKNYDGGKCFFIAVTSVTAETINVKGFGRDADSFQTLYKSFMDQNGIEPELNGHLINEAQCAAADFLKKVQPGATDSPELSLAADRLKVSDPLVMTVGNIGDRALDVLLVHGDGLVYNVKSFANTVKEGSRLNFQVKFTKQLVESELPEMVIAITTPQGLSIPEGDQHVRAAALFPKLQRQIEAMGGEVGIDFAYFQIRP